MKIVCFGLISFIIDSKFLVIVLALLLFDTKPIPHDGGNEKLVYCSKRHDLRNNILCTV